MPDELKRGYELVTVEELLPDRKERYIFGNLKHVKYPVMDYVDLKTWCGYNLYKHKESKDYFEIWGVHR